MTTTPHPSVVAAAASAEVLIVALDARPLQPTDMLPTDELPDGPSLAELARLLVLFVAASILVGAAGFAIFRRSRG